MRRMRPKALIKLMPAAERIQTDHFVQVVLQWCIRSIAQTIYDNILKDLHLELRTSFGKKMSSRHSGDVPSITQNIRKKTYTQNISNIYNHISLYRHTHILRTSYGESMRTIQMFTGYVAQRYYTPYYESQPGSWLVLFCERSENRGSGGGSCQTGRKRRKQVVFQDRANYGFAG